MERNAAGDVVQQHTSAMLHVAPTSSTSVVRFKLYFSVSPPTHVSSNGSQPLLVPVQQRNQLTHLMVPFRLPMAGVTLQDLADQAVSRISKRYPQLTQQCEVEGFDVVPLVWEGGGGGCGSPQSHGPSSSSTAAADQGGKLHLASPSQGQPALGTVSSNWAYDVASTYRLDLAMNGLDDLEFYFDLQPQVGGATSLSGTSNAAMQLQMVMSMSMPPPFELIVIWRPRPGRQPPVNGGDLPAMPAPTTAPVLPPPRSSTPNRMLPSQPAGTHGGRCSPSVGPIASLPPQHSVPPPVSKPPLPPLHTSGTRHPPARLPSLEPRKPSDGAARYRQLTPDASPPVDDVALPLMLPPEGQSPDAQRITGGHNAGDGTPSMSARASNEEQDLRFKDGSVPFRRISSEQLLALDELNSSTPRNSSAISPTRASAGVKGGSGRRSVTTFLEQQQDDGGLATSCHEHPTSALLTRTTSPNDSEANLEEVITFQSQLIQMTEVEDRDTIHIQEAMERSLMAKAKQVELGIAQVGGRPPQPWPHSVTVSASSSGMTSPRGRQQQPQPNNASRYDFDHGLEQAVTVERRGLTASLDVANTAMHGDAASPVARAPHRGVHASGVLPVVSSSSSGGTASIPHSNHQASSVSSVEAAALFAAAPTSRAVLERLRAESGQSANSEVMRQPSETSPTPSSDNEALLLACDELLNDWFHLRHVVLTEERKDFRALSQQFKHLQREQFSDMTAMIRNEALGFHAKQQYAITASSQSPNRHASLRGTQHEPQEPPQPPPSVGPPRPLPRTLTTAEEASTVGIEVPPSYSVGPATKTKQQQEALTPIPPPIGSANDHPSRSHYHHTLPQHCMDEALLRLLKIVDVTEQSERRELRDEEVERFNHWNEEQVIAKKRVQLRAEQALILHERQLLQDELSLRLEIANAEDRKFSMFTGLCQKGIQRLRGASGASPSSKTVNSWMEL